MSDVACYKIKGCGRQIKWVWQEHREDYLIRSEGLLGVGILEEVSNGQDVESSVHHDEEEDA